VNRYAKQSHSVFAVALMCALFVATVKADDEPVARLVVFGDSLSDGGFYIASNPLIPPGAGSFTTNPDPVAVEVLAFALRLPLATVNDEDGTNYAVGGARVTEPNLLSVPITTQIDNFLAAGDTFSSRDAVYIQGGGNDLFAFVADGATDTSILTDAATELAVQVERLEDLGVGRIVTMAIQSFGIGDVQLFNETYEGELVSRGVNVLYFDNDSLYDEIVASADEFGITNLTDTACTVSSLICTPFSFVEADANETYLRADGVHPAGIAQLIQGQAIASLVVAPEQIGQLPYAAQALFAGQRALYWQVMQNGLGQDVGDSAYYGDIARHAFGNGGSNQRVSVREEGILANVGVDHQFSATLGAGFSFAYSTGDGRFGSDRGDYDVDAFSGSLYVRRQFGALNVRGDLSLGRVDYGDLTRKVVLGPTSRFHSDETNGTYTALRVGVSYDIWSNDFFTLGSQGALSYEQAEVDGYSEDEELSTAAEFGDQELQSTLGSIGFFAQVVGQGTFGYFAQANYMHEFNDDSRDITMTPFGAPMSFTSLIQSTDDDYLSYDLAITIDLNQAISLRTGVSGYAFRGELDSNTILVGVTISL